MAKEINLLDLQIPVKRAVEHQLTLPNLLEGESEPVRSAERGQKNQIKKVIEALLFASNEPLSFQRLREIIETKLPLKPKLLRDALEDLREDYIDQQRAFLLEENPLGFILKTREEYSGYVEQLFRNKREEKLSQAAIEVMAIIAYKQPITKPQIDAIRGVDCSGTMQNLLERELVQHVGKLDAPGRPTLFGTTPHFLTHFGLKSLEELPGITVN
jgi:segregation and condensation protein B